MNGVVAGAMLTAMSGLAQDLVEPGLEGKNSHGTLGDRDGDRDRGQGQGNEDGIGPLFPTWIPFPVSEDRGFTHNLYLLKPGTGSR